MISCLREKRRLGISRHKKKKRSTIKTGAYFDSIVPNGCVLRSIMQEDRPVIFTSEGSHTAV